MSNEYDIVSPVPADAEEIGRLHVRVWQEAYAGLMPAEYLAGLDSADRVKMWRTVLTQRGAPPLGDEPDDVTTRPRTRAARHRSSGAIIGIATAGPARDPEPVVAAELWMVNVESRHRGTGVTIS